MSLPVGTHQFAYLPCPRTSWSYSSCQRRNRHFVHNFRLYRVVCPVLDTKSTETYVIGVVSSAPSCELRAPLPSAFFCSAWKELSQREAVSDLTERSTRTPRNDEQNGTGHSRASASLRLKWVSLSCFVGQDFTFGMLAYFAKQRYFCQCFAIHREPLV